MILRYRIKDHHALIHAHGWVLGQEHLKHPLGELQTYPAPQIGSGHVVVLDFDGIESVTASYLKSTFMWLLLAGQTALEERAPSAQANSDREPPPLPVFPMVTGLSDEVAEELEEVLARHQKPCLEALEFGQDQVLKARLRGPLDRLLRWTMMALCKEKEASASDLQEYYQADNLNPDKRINSTGWSNRLADLYTFRLVCRRKQGKQWLYRPIVPEVISG